MSTGYVGVRSFVNIPQTRINAELALENAIKRRSVRGSLFAKGGETRFNELVAVAEHWIGKAKEVELDAACQGGYALDSYMHAVGEAKRAVELLWVEPLARSGLKLSDSGKLGGSSRPAPAWHDKVVTHAKTLLASGRERHELTGICAAKFDKSEDATRAVLQSAGLVPKRNSRV